MNFADYTVISLRRDGKVLHATMNLPDSMNAFEDALQDDFERLIADVAKDPQTHVLVLTGAGRAFSAGGNIEDMQVAIRHPEQFLKGVEVGERHLYAILDCPKPIIAKVNGAAIGLGATIALYCDIVIAANHAKIADPHVMMGLSAGDGGSIVWPALMGFPRARVHLLTGDPITGEEAARVGLIYKAVPAEELDAAVDELAQRIANGASKAVQATKLSLAMSLKAVTQAALSKTMQMEMGTQRTKDHQEAVNAFREKRKPAFTGE